MAFSVDVLAARLLPGPGEPPPVDGKRRAAVAALLHHGEHGPAVLLMKRAERIGDPWSGQIALPGGRHEASDPDLQTTAVREAAEELSLSLATDARYLGRLPALHPRSSGPSGMEVSPYVFATDVVPVTRLGAEATAAFWLPLTKCALGELDGMYTWPGPPMSGMVFPCWLWEGFTVWGLTMRILSDLLVAGKP
ncbi:MAG TPA: CoA pyrophosphatase [Kofleriaceae bacterium]|nr:CoA pyrophosphatase [Kofleriaceae bacterium]